MSTPGASTFSLDKNNPQLEQLKRKMESMVFSAENILSQFNIRYPDTEAADSNFRFFCDDIELQFYKFYNAAPGELIKITSMITPTWGVEAYATRDLEGNFEIILQGPNGALKILDSQSWEPSTSLTTHLDYLSQKFGENPPSHLQPYINKSMPLYAQAIKENKRDMLDLHPGDICTIPAEPAKGRNHPLHVLKTSASEFQILLETGNAHEPFIQLNNEKKVVYKEYKDTILDEQAITFLQRTEKSRDDLKKNGLPPELLGLISADDLLQMYDYVLNNPTAISKLSSGKEFRIDKSITGNPRTMNIIREPNGNFMLMLETKLKLASGVKDSTRLVGAGAFGTVKPAWRIDSTPPEEWVNKSMKGEKTLEADYEAIFSHRLVENQRDNNHAAATLNTTLLGELFTSKDEVKRSQYSKRAIGDLSQVLENPDIHLTDKDKARITKNILEAMNLIHGQDKVHQDIKLPNIFVYKDEEGYFAKVGDFGLGQDAQAPREKPALASGGYESPEILLANEALDTKFHEYYHNNPWFKSNSYAYQKHEEDTQRNPDSSEAIEYRKPNPANDMWAVGIVLYSVHHGKEIMPTDAGVSAAPPFIQGLLQAKRENRLTASQALATSSARKVEQATPTSSLQTVLPTDPKPILFSSTTTKPASSPFSIHGATPQETTLQTEQENHARNNKIS